jgi:hypothetical protein
MQAWESASRLRSEGVKPGTAAYRAVLADLGATFGKSTDQIEREALPVLEHFAEQDERRGV